MKVYFVRHGETKYNAEHVLMGSEVDAPLDEAGIAQAKEIASKLTHHIDIIFCSPLQRAMQTALIISNNEKLAIHPRPELEERDFGDLSGKPLDEVEKIMGISFKQIEAHFDIDVSKFHIESGKHMQLRLMHFLAELKAKYSDKTPLVITHSGIINLMYQLYPNTPHFEADNASIHSFEI